MGFAPPGVSIIQTGNSTNVTEDGTIIDNNTIALTSVPTDAVTITLTPSNAEIDLGAGAGVPITLNFNPDDTALNAKTVNFIGINDSVAEGNHTSIITHSGSSLDPNYNNPNLPFTVDGIAGNTVPVNIIDNDSIGINLTTSDTLTSEAGDTGNFNLVLTSQPTSDVLVSLTNNDTTEGSLSTPNITFTPNNWSTPQLVTVTGVNDNIQDGDIPYSIITSINPNSDSNYINFPPDTLNFINQDNDSIGININSLDTLTSEDGDTGNFNLVLTSQPTSDVLVSLTNNDTTEGSLSTDSITFTPNNWSTPKLVTVTGVNDNIQDGDIPYSIITSISPSSDSKYINLPADTLNFINQDNDSIGINLTTSDTLTSEAGDTGNFNLVLTSQPTSDVLVSLTNNDTTEGSLSTSSLTFTPNNWSTPQLVTITGVNDNIQDGDIPYSIITSISPNSDSKYTTLPPQTINFINQDNDSIGINLTTSDTLTSEAGDTANFNLVLTSQPTSDVLVSLTNNDTTEGSLSTPNITFTPNNWSTPQLVTVTGVNDNIQDGDISYSIITSINPSSDSKYIDLPPQTINLINQDNDSIGINLTTSDTLTSEAGDTANFNLVLTSQPTSDVLVSLTNNDTTEGSLSTPNITFTPNNWSTPQLVTVTGVNDNIQDGDIPYSIISSIDPSSDSQYTTLPPDTLNFINQDNDSIGININSLDTLTSEDGDTGSFEITLNSQPTSDVLISLNNSDTLEGSLSTDSITFTPNNWSTPQLVTITGVDDNIQDGNIPYSIITSINPNSDSKYINLPADTLNFINHDNDSIGININSLDTLTSEDGDTGSFEITLNSQPTSDVLISLNNSDTLEGSLSTDSITFTPNNWSTPQLVTVTGVNDNIQDGDISYSIITSINPSSDSKYIDLPPQTINLINQDNDSIGINLTTSDTLTSEAGDTGNFNLVLTSQPTSDVLVSLTNNDTTEGSLSTPNITFTPNNWSTPKLVTVTGVNDNIQDGNIPYSIITSINPNSDSKYINLPADTLNFINQDNDSIGINLTTSDTLTSEAGDTGNFNLVLTSQPTSDVLVSLTNNDTTEGSLSTPNITFTPNNWSTPQLVTVTGVNDNIQDGDIPYSIITSISPNSDSKYTTLPPHTLNFINQDNDSIGININSLDTLTSEDGDTGSFEITLNSQPTSDVLVSLTNNDTTEGSLSTPNITFTPNNWSTPQLVTVIGVNDNIQDGNIPYSIITSINPSSDSKYINLPADTLNFINQDNDSIGININSLDTLTSEDGDTGSFEITLNSQPTSDVLVSLTNNDTTEGSLSTDSITFTPNNWSISQLVTVTGVDDDVQDGNISYSIITSIAQNSESQYSNLPKKNITFTNIDDDTANILINPNILKIIEGSNNNYSIVLTTEPIEPITISFNTDKELEPIPEITFDQSNWNIPQTVLVKVVDNQLLEGDRSTNITHQITSF
ncbi:MAG: hypothetical protein RSE13_04355 [Planktothrix sp. GU0601_MAG3]|nr:MAG: hypothetical protein RSE13_04355 [Planktothrix sp. GU0601_MAG3]